ncbi:hypothetical protein PR048_019092 [Dryococelus australis]|uniref:Uncharacterized protein n=1 Tax=Dryococelus australis TaxID=614101 RepID=A0ABQ9H2N0_9NEOP|nr:hypothetical protein PR048_019092 [Dryococelus australis]
MGESMLRGMGVREKSVYLASMVGMSGSVFATNRNIRCGECKAGGALATDLRAMARCQEENAISAHHLATLSRALARLSSWRVPPHEPSRPSVLHAARLRTAYLIGSLLPRRPPATESVGAPPNWGVEGSGFESRGLKKCSLCRKYPIIALFRLKKLACEESEVGAMSSCVHVASLKPHEDPLSWFGFPELSFRLPSVCCRCRPCWPSLLSRLPPTAFLLSPRRGWCCNRRNAYGLFVVTFNFTEPLLKFYFQGIPPPHANISEPNTGKTTLQGHLVGLESTVRVLSPRNTQSYARLHHRGSELDPRSYLRSTQKTVAPFEFRAGLEIEMKLSLNRRNLDLRSGAIIDESEIQNHEILLVQHFYIGTKIKLDFGSELGSFDLGSGKQLVQPGIRKTARLARRSDEELGVRVSVARIAPSLLDLEHLVKPVTTRLTGSLRIFACGNSAGRCPWSVVFLRDLPFPPPLHSGAAPYSSRSPSSALKISLLRAAKIYPLRLKENETFKKSKEKIGVIVAFLCCYIAFNELDSIKIEGNLKRNLTVWKCLKAGRWIFAVLRSKLESMQTCLGRLPYVRTCNKSPLFLHGRCATEKGVDVFTAPFLSGIFLQELSVGGKSATWSCRTRVVCVCRGVNQSITLWSGYAGLGTYAHTYLDLLQFNPKNEIVSAAVKGPACLRRFFSSEKRGSYKGYTGTLYKSAIAATRSALNWCAFISRRVDSFERLVTLRFADPISMAQHSTAFLPMRLSYAAWLGFVSTGLAQCYLHSILVGATQVFSHVDNEVHVAGVRWVFSGYSRLPLPSVPLPSIVGFHFTSLFKDDGHLMSAVSTTLHLRSSGLPYLTRGSQTARHGQVKYFEQYSSCNCVGHEKEFIMLSDNVPDVNAPSGESSNIIGGVSSGFDTRALSVVIAGVKRCLCEQNSSCTLLVAHNDILQHLHRKYLPVPLSNTGLGGAKQFPSETRTEVVCQNREVNDIQEALTPFARISRNYLSIGCSQALPFPPLSSFLCVTTTFWGCGGAVVRPLASCLGEPGSIPRRAIVPGDAVSRPVFSGFSLIIAFRCDRSAPGVGQPAPNSSSILLSSIRDLASGGNHT